MLKEVLEIIRLKRNRNNTSHRAKTLKRSLCKTCAMCGCPAKEIHHIKGVTEYPELKNHINNMIIVCADCHKKIHKEEKNGRVLVR
jgi:5-methylcytosine-specific restriction endonuclease McrA